MEIRQDELVTEKLIVSIQVVGSGWTSFDPAAPISVSAMALEFFQNNAAKEKTRELNKQVP